FYTALHPDNPLGRLILNPSATKNAFLLMLKILIVAYDPYTVLLQVNPDEI
ncbi:hypothetical protein V1519DRAFT_388465, partial [Lipomyces tetrasporus]